MTKKHDKPEITPDQIWIPPEKIDENVRRMAWLLFLEWWKCHAGWKAAPTHQRIGDAYKNSLAAAQIVRKLELQPVVSIEDDNDARHMKLAQELEDERRESEDQA